MNASLSLMQTKPYLTSSPILPKYFLEEQKAAQKEFESSPSPKRTDEAWRFSDLSVINLQGFTSPNSPSDPAHILSLSNGLANTAGKMVFANDCLISRSIENLPKGILFLPLDEALRNHESLIREFFMAQPVELGSHKFAALHRANVKAGTFLYVPDNVEIPFPFEVFHWVEGENASVFPHTLVVCGKNSRIAILDRFNSLDNHRAFACAINDLHLAPGAQLTYAAIQDWSPTSLAFHLNSTVVGKDAQATSLSVNFGGKFIRGESLSRLIAPGARSEMFSLNLLDQQRIVDQRTLQDHVSPSASSDLLYLNALSDSSKSIFSGMIRVGTGAHRTDAYQKVRNLLLSDMAEANSMPGLEILADDVRCTHGATSSDISEDELFYLQARGINKTIGKKLIVNGFFESLIQRLNHPIIRTEISRKIANKLEIPHVQPD